MRILKFIGYAALAIAAVVAFFGWKTIQDVKSECDSDRRLAGQALKNITFTNTYFDGDTLKTRLHNSSSQNIHGDFVFEVSLQDCNRSGCTNIGRGRYFVRGGRRDIVPAGSARDVTARPILDSGIPDVRAQGQVQYSYELVEFGVGSMGTVQCE